MATPTYTQADGKQIKFPRTGSYNGVNITLDDGDTFKFAESSAANARSVIYTYDAAIRTWTVLS